MVVVGTVVELMGANSNGTVVGVGGDSDLPTIGRVYCTLYATCILTNRDATGVVERYFLVDLGKNIFPNE